MLGDKQGSQELVPAGESLRFRYEHESLILAQDERWRRA